MKDKTFWMSIGGYATVLGLTLFLAALPGVSRADTQWDVGVSGGDHGIDGFHLSVGNYYGVPEREVVVVHERGIDDDELPVVFYLARQARVDPDVIVDMRLDGMSWMDITLHFGLYPDIYYVPVPVYVYKHYPHGHAWGYYGKYRHRDDWRRIRLADRDVVNQVNLRFMKDHYRYAPDRVMKYRSQGKRYSAIDREIWRERHGNDRGRYYTDRDWRRGNDRNWEKNWKQPPRQGSGNVRGESYDRKQVGGKKEKSQKKQQQQQGGNGREHGRH